MGFKKKPISSPAADNIIENALKCSKNDPLYIIAIGAITNVASAILKEPKIINKIVVVLSAMAGETNKLQNYLGLQYYVYFLEKTD